MVCHESFILGVVIGGVGEDVWEHLGVVCAAVFFGPDVGETEFVESDHVGERDTAQDGAKEFGSLCDDGRDEESSVAGAANRESIA